jgi:hypothetical protein
MPVDDFSLDSQELIPLQDAATGAPGDALITTLPALNEDSALALLKRKDLTPEVLEKLSQDGAIAKSRKVKLGIVAHPKTPRYVSVSLLRQLFSFDLMKVALTPAIAGDIKAAAEEILIKRLESLSSGERISLARRASGRVVGALLLDSETRVIHAALENSKLTEALVIRALMTPVSPRALVHSVCAHPKWSLRREIRVTLLRNEKTPLRFAQEFARTLPIATLKEILQTSRMTETVKNCLLNSR